MPPRQKKSEDEKQKDYNTWLAGPENQAIEEAMVEMKKLKFDNGTCDISDDFQPYLNKLHAMVAALKVPGRKAKSYEQMYIRTMFFEKCEKIKIDDFFFEIPNSCNVDMVNCKNQFADIKVFLTEGQWEMNDYTSYANNKKELVKMLKKFETMYNKHIKTSYKEMSVVHATAMSPLTKLLDANVNFHQLELMKERGDDVPDFRYNALETEFSKFLTGILEILKTFGTLHQSFDIPQMLKTMKIKNWRNIRPFEFYMSEMDDKIKKVRTELLTMHKLGHLRCKYIIEQNLTMAKLMESMVTCDRKI